MPTNRSIQFKEASLGRKNKTRLHPITILYTIPLKIFTGYAGMAASKAGELVKLINNADTKIVNGITSNALVKDVTSIADSKDLWRQREYFCHILYYAICISEN